MNEDTRNIKFYPQPPTWAAGAAVLVALSVIVFLGVLTWNAVKEHDYIGRTAEQIYTITLAGEGKVTAIPDIAQVSLGVESEKPNVADAQLKNTEIMNQLLADLKALDIEAKDITTANYNIYPRYDYFDGRQVLRGYIVSQSVLVKIRDLEKVGAVLELAGRSGVNQLGGLNFTIDEPETLRQQAREKALKNAREKAETLAQVADVKLGKLVSFSESSNGFPGPVYYKSYALEVGVGGGAPAPEVEPGSQDIVVNVTVTYEVL